MALTVKQQEFLNNCYHRWNVKTGATRSGKTFVDFTVTIPKRILAAKDEGLLVLMGNTRGTLERNILEPMRLMWPGLVGRIASDNTLYMFGRKVYALGADNKKHMSRIQGATFEYVYGDEIATWSEEVFQMLKSRLSCEHSHFDGTCNPDSPGHWFKQFLDSDADIYQQTYIIDDGTLSPTTIAELKKEYAGTVYYDRFILGEWAAATGLIYPMYADAVAELPDGEPDDYLLSLDYGTQNAFAGLLFGRWGTVWHVMREYYYSGRESGVQKTDEDYAVDLDGFIEDIRPGKLVSTVIDPSAASFITLLRRRGRYSVIPAVNTVADGIRETATAMRNGLVKISPDCVNLLHELSGYAWDGNAHEDRPVKENDHACDALRYAVKTRKMAKKQEEAFIIPGF